MSFSGLPAWNTSSTSREYGRLLGEFEGYAHGIVGTVYAVDDTTLFVKGFTYDGTAPDAFFWTGKTPRPNPDGIILPHPENYTGRLGFNEIFYLIFIFLFFFQGMNSFWLLNNFFFFYREPPILKSYDHEDVILRLPVGKRLRDMKWLSIWCRRFTVSLLCVEIPPFKKE